MVEIRDGGVPTYLRYESGNQFGGWLGFSICLRSRGVWSNRKVAAPQALMAWDRWNSWGDGMSG